MPPQNMLLWEIGYFKLIIVKAQKAQKEAVTFPLTV